MSVYEDFNSICDFLGYASGVDSEDPDEVDVPGMLVWATCVLRCRYGFQVTFDGESFIGFADDRAITDEFNWAADEVSLCEAWGGCLAALCNWADTLDRERTYNEN